MICFLHGDKLQVLGSGLEKAGRKVEAKYPVPLYQYLELLYFPNLLCKLSKL